MIKIDTRDTYQHISEPQQNNARWFGRPIAALALAATVLLSASCASEEPESQSVIESNLSAQQKASRYELIRDSARARGIYNGYLLAGIGNTETGLAHCWSEATWACQGPNSPDCNGGPVIAGSADGACSIQEGGLGLFQFDSGTYASTLNTYGDTVLTIDGQTDHVIQYVIRMIRDSEYTTNAETDEKARIWLNNFDFNNATLRDQWIRTVLRYYNGCKPEWSCWAPRYQTYSDGLLSAVNDPGGLAFWATQNGTRCGDSPATIGAIDVKYRELGGCNSVLGAPIAEERSTPDGDGRYSVFENGSIYWTAETGAFEVHGLIRDAWKERGWEAGELGYPISDEYDIAGGRQNDFELGTITWNSSTGETTVAIAGNQAPRWKVLPVDYQIQSTGYWCGPAATRVALSARMNAPSQSTLASQLGTTVNGTDWIGQITNVLNSRLGADKYKTTELANDPPSQGQRSKLWSDIVLSIDNHYPLVANIVAPPTNHPPGYPQSTIYHYFSVIGYNPDSMQVYIADSANFSGNQLYWLSFDQLATLIPPKGYSSYKCPEGMTTGAIKAKYDSLGGCSSVVGGAVTSELTTADGIGRYNVFENGSMYWSPSTGAHEVHGAIRDKWRDLGWENGSLGYPISDEYPAVDGKRSDFEHGSLVWKASTGEVVVLP